MSIPGLEEMRALPRPTRAQREAFVEQLCWAHSWYKHLPFAGADFVVFLAADAGGDHDELHPRLHHGWKTAAEYQRRFGLLDHAWRLDPGEPWSRDAHEPVDALPGGLWPACGVSLTPMCSNDGNAIEVLCARWRDDDRDAVTAGVAARLDALVIAYDAAEQAYQVLSRDEQVLLIDRELDAAIPASPAVLACEALRRALDAHYDALRRPEVAKIERALDALASLLG